MRRILTALIVLAASLNYFEAISLDHPPAGIDQSRDNTVKAPIDPVRDGISIQSSQAIFDYLDGEEGKRVGLRLPKGDRKTKAILYCHQNMTEEVLFRSPLFTSKMDSLGVAMVFVQSGSQNWDIASGCQERFDSIMETLSSKTGDPEFSNVPVIPFGHSAQATFPWNFAAWNPNRTLCIISYHGDAPRTNLTGYGGPNIEWGRTRNIDSIPGLMIEGEYEWWEARVRPALAFKMMYPDSRISFLCDAGKGHFDLSEETQLYIAQFIEKALADPRPTDGIYYSKWNEEGIESENPYEQFWYQDQEMVDLTRERYAKTRGKRMQYVGAKVNGEIVPYDTTKHIKMSVAIDGEKFTVEPVFFDDTRTKFSDLHADVKPRIVLISGPAIQTGEHTFIVDRDYFGKDPRRQWTGVTVCIEADGDEEYKSAVQELNIHLKTLKDGN